VTEKRKLHASTARYPEGGLRRRCHSKLVIIDEDFYNTDGNGVILIVEREDHLFAEAARPEGPFVGQPAEAGIMPGTVWLESPNDVIEAWYGSFHDGGQLIRPNVRPAA
jgi:hypothetical protein